MKTKDSKRVSGKGEAKSKGKAPTKDRSGIEKAELIKAKLKIKSKIEEAKKKKEELIKTTEKPRFNVLLFNRWDLSDVVVEDPGLRGYINLEPILVPRTDGRYATKEFQKNRMNIVERFMNKLMVPGHRGKKHKLTSGHFPGNTQTLYNSVKRAFEILEEKTKKNPVQVLVRAIENSALLEEVASYRLGGIIARNAVVTSPQRRLDLALRYLTQGIYKSTFKSKRTLAETIAEELILASNNDPKSFAVSERNRIEREAEGAR